MQPICGEVVASSARRCTAQCLNDESVPELGSFVAIDSEGGLILGVVIEIRTSSLDPSRRPMAYGLDEEELARQQPQLAALLLTEFEAALVAWAPEGEPLSQRLPPRPPRLHRGVRQAERSDVAALAESGDWLRTLVDAEVGDDLLALAVRSATATAGDPAVARLAAGRSLARLVGADYERLQVLLRRLGS